MDRISRTVLTRSADASRFTSFTSWTVESRATPCATLSKLPPEFNPDQPSSSPLYVVVEVELDEPLSRVFTQTGFYVLPQLSPDEAETRIFPPA
jgi:hypothetical protein